MKTDLYRGAPADKKAARKAMIYSCQDGFEIVQAVLQAKLEELQTKLLSAQYNSPAWAQLQADMIGEARAYKYTIDLLTLDRDKD